MAKEYFCKKCGKSRGILNRYRRGGELTGELCVKCANSKPSSTYCKHCQCSFELPKEKTNNNHWRWDKNKSSPKGGYFRCKKQIADKNSKWVANNPIKCKEKSDKASKKYRSTIQGRLRSNMSSRMSFLLKKRGLDSNSHDSKIKTLDWTIEELKKHLESQFQKGMSWSNYGKWHVDHVVPDSWFSYSSCDDEGFKKSWSLNNLQPLWAKENLKKCNSYAGGGLSLF